MYILKFFQNWGVYECCPASSAQIAKFFSPKNANFFSTLPASLTLSGTTYVVLAAKPDKPGRPINDSSFFPFANFFRVPPALLTLSGTTYVKSAVKSADIANSSSFTYWLVVWVIF